MGCRYWAERPGGAGCGMGCRYWAERPGGAGCGMGCRVRQTPEGVRKDGKERDKRDESKGPGKTVL